MKRQACAFLGATIAVIGLAAPAAAQPARAETYTTPLPPPREVLDRLNLKMAWRLYVPMDGRRDGLASVQLHGTDLYVQTRSGLVMLVDPESGVVHWRTRVGLPYRVTHELAFNSREVYVVNNLYLFALDRRTGTPRWRYRLREGVSAPPWADENFIYIASASGRIAAYYLPRPEVAVVRSPGDLGAPSLDELTGLKGIRALESEEERRQRIVSVKGDTTTTTAPISHLTSGTSEASREEEVGPRPVRVWEEVVSLRLELPVLSTRTNLLVPTPDGIVVALDKLPRQSGTAAEVYRFPTDSAITVPAGQFEDTAYVGTEDANLYALDMANGQIRWRHTAGTAFSRKPAVTDQDIYVVATRKGMARLDRTTGETLWRIPVRGQLVENNAAADRFLAVNPKYVYVADASGRLLVLDRRRGVYLSGYDTKDFVYPISNEVTDRIYLAANNGLIVCLHDRAYEQPIRHRKAEEEAQNPLRIRLSEPIDDPGSPPMTLRALLDDWTKRFPPLKFRIAEQGYKLAGRESPAESQVKAPRADKKPLGEVLKLVLDQVKSVYEIVGDTVVILPAAAPAPEK
jgi:outer membrane protein assembly factor BamB